MTNKNFSFGEHLSIPLRAPDEKLFATYNSIPLKHVYFYKVFFRKMLISECLRGIPNEHPK